MTEPGELSADDVQPRLQEAIAGALRPELVTKWVAVVETIDADGMRGLWTVADDSVRPWDTLGMLHYAIGKERTRDDDDDG